MAYCKEMAPSSLHGTWQTRRRIHKPFAAQGPQVHLDGLAEVDETDVDGKKRRTHGRNRFWRERGRVDKTAMVVAKDLSTSEVPAQGIWSPDTTTHRGFVTEHPIRDARLFIDDATADGGLPKTSPPFAIRRANRSTGDSTPAE